ncbi:hypothetical protein ACC691_39220, partial [Rhizobium johnstonii]|uniref:hypothetical protein n=1 Tax=Rhizobium johnstonii TaxID=3019933 RepID=UPI003F99F053
GSSDAGSPRNNAFNLPLRVARETCDCSAKEKRAALSGSSEHARSVVPAMNHAAIDNLFRIAHKKPT